MQIVPFEEHLTSSAVVDARDELHLADRDDSVDSLNTGDVARRLNDVGEERLRLMDESGVDIQVSP